MPDPINRDTPSVVSHHWPKKSSGLKGNGESVSVEETMKPRKMVTVDASRTCEAGFYGLDLESLQHGCVHACCSRCLDRIDPDAAKMARRRYGCFQLWVDDSASCVVSHDMGMENCEVQVVAIRTFSNTDSGMHDVDPLNGEEFSKKRLFGERYYQLMHYSSAMSWMATCLTLARLFRTKGENVKAVAWAYCGDARYPSIEYG